EVGTLDLLDRDNVDLPTLEWGQVQAQAGRAAFDQIKTAIELAMAGELEAMESGGVPFLDHTAMLTKLANSPDTLTMFVVRKLVIFFMARHMSMRKACDEVTAENVSATLIK